MSSSFTSPSLSHFLYKLTLHVLILPFLVLCSAPPLSFLNKTYLILYFFVFEDTDQIFTNYSLLVCRHSPDFLLLSYHILLFVEGLYYSLSTFLLLYHLFKYFFPFFCNLPQWFTTVVYLNGSPLWCTSGSPQWFTTVVHHCGVPVVHHRRFL